MRHGYTNTTAPVAGGVLKTYDGPDAAHRAATELAALTRLAGVLPVPAVLASVEAMSVTTGFRAGRHGQELIDEGRAEEVLAACGALLRRLQDLEPALLTGTRSPAGDVIVHGDFGPHNLLLDPDGRTVTALLDWEFCEVGSPIVDLAWCEWIVRMHHPTAVGQLPAYFAAYGVTPAWSERKQAMVARCRWLETFADRQDPTGVGAATWRHRSRITQGWSEA